MRRRRLVLLALAAAAASPAARAADLTRVVWERTLMREAGARCKLFDPRVQAALAAGAGQARAAALRAGAEDDAVAGVEARARARADATPCDAPDLHVAAQRVRAAFLGWSRQETMSLPGERGGWRALRRAPRGDGAPFWALASSGRLGGGVFTVGLRAPAGSRDAGAAAFALETSAPEAARAWTARLVLRDPARAPRPYLAADGRPPEEASRTVSASGKRALDGGRAWRFSFPPAAADALAALDPREHARVELVLPEAGGDRVVSALVEAGDFAVGRAFLSAGAPPR